jgi:hypothetical protein
MIASEGLVYFLITIQHWFFPCVQKVVLLSNHFMALAQDSIFLFSYIFSFYEMKNHGNAF